VERARKILAALVNDAASGLRDDLRRRADAIHDHRRSMRVRFQDHEPERLDAERRDDRGDGARVERAQLRVWEPAEEAHMRQPCRRRAQLLRVLAVARDEQIRIVVLTKCGDDVLQAFDLFQPPNE
jgi:hypothetical protein